MVVPELLFFVVLEQFVRDELELFFRVSEKLGWVAYDQVKKEH